MMQKMRKYGTVGSHFAVTGGKARHSRHDKITSERDGPPGHLPQALPLVLLFRHRREKNSVHCCHNEVICRIGVMLPLLKEGHLCISFSDTNDQRIDFLIPYVQQRSPQQFHSIVEQSAEPLP